MLKKLASLKDTFFFKMTPLFVLCVVHMHALTVLLIVYFQYRCKLQSIPGGEGLLKVYCCMLQDVLRRS